jgi:hypothetical protein
MSNSVTVFSAETTALTFATKKGDLRTVTAEGAVFRGGLALAALKDASLESALNKAYNGRYAAAADILDAAFPSVTKAVLSLMGAPSANKANMGALISGVERAVEPAKGWNKKQVAARHLARALRTVPAFAKEEVVTIEAVAA